MKELLQEIDELLAHLEDFTHGKTGEDITKMRKKINDILPEKTLKKEAAINSLPQKTIEKLITENNNKTEKLVWEAEIKLNCFSNKTITKKDFDKFYKKYRLFYKITSFPKSNDITSYLLVGNLDIRINYIPLPPTYFTERSFIVSSKAN